MNRREFAVTAAGVIASTSIGAVAYSNASVTRDISVEIAADNNAAIGLSPGTTNAVSIEDSVLVIDTSTPDSDGLNPDGEFTYGNPSDPGAEYAFALTNNDGDQRTFTFELDGFALPASASFVLELYDDTGTLVGDITPTQTQQVTLDSTATANVVMSISTDGLTETDDITGTLSITAE